jgi:hypothetical protein
MKYIDLKKDKSFILYFILINLVIGILNRNSQMMGGLIEYYLDFKNIITHDFNVNYAKMNCPTFPMWGYGWIFILSTNKIIIFILQFIFSFYTIMYLIYFLRHFEKFLEQQINYFKIIILISTSFISITYTLSPYSIAINLQILAIIFFVQILKSNKNIDKIRYILYSSLSFGLLLNFRSDYVYFSVILPIILYYIQPIRYNIFLGFLWLLMTFLLLLPWMVYTKHAVGKPLLTSTNSGHVFYIGLGNLPNNKWNITTSDQDSQMYSILKKEFGKNTSSLRYKEDNFLKRKFFHLVTKDPIEYFKKSSYSFLMTLISGIYVPEFYNTLNNCSSLGCKEDFKSDLKNKPISSLYTDYQKSIIYLITYFSIFFGIIVILFSHLLLPFFLYKGIYEKNIFIILSTFVISYQLLINTLAFQMKLYSTYSYIWSLILFLYFLKLRKIKS